MTTKLFTKVDMLEKQLAEETKEKYALYKRIKELNEEIRALKNKGDDLSGPEYIQRHRT